VAGAWAAEAASSAMDIDNILGGGYLPTYSDQALSALPGGMGNQFLSPEAQQYRTGASIWTQANLRPESGAVINADEEEKYFVQYFPQPGDSTAVIEQKARARSQKLQSRLAAAGAAETKVLPPPPIVEASGAGEGDALIQTDQLPPGLVDIETPGRGSMGGGRRYGGVQ